VKKSTSADSLGYATAYDNCSDTIAMIVFSDSVVIRTCPVDQLIYRKWTATDSCGNESSCIQLISVEPIPGPFFNLSLTIRPYLHVRQKLMPPLMHG
jgi:hypothetical protein